MTRLDTADVPRVAAEAALAVPGVRELRPALSRSLAGAAHRIQALGESPPPETGVRVQHDRRTGAWRVEVRCVLDGDRRALDTAREVRRRVRSAVAARCASTPAAVVVAVDVTRITAGFR